MITKEQARLISHIYKRFLESEHERRWDELDECLEKLDWLNTEELVKEAEILYMYHKECGDHACEHQSVH